MQVRRRFGFGGAVCLAVLLAACGGSSSSGGPNPVSVSLDSDPTNTTYLITGFPNIVWDGVIIVGDTNVDAPVRGFCRFELTGIPATATIVSAELRMHQLACQNTPYGLLGSVLLDHMNFGGNISMATLTASSLPGGSAFATLSSACSPDSLTADCTAQVQADLQAGRTRIDLRLRFTLATNGDSFGNWVEIASPLTNLQGVEKPTLVVTYQ